MWAPSPSRMVVTRMWPSGVVYVLHVVGEVEEDLDVLDAEAAAVGEDAVVGDDLVDAAGVEGWVFAAQHEQSAVKGEHGVGRLDFGGYVGLLEVCVDG